MSDHLHSVPVHAFVLVVVCVVLIGCGGTSSVPAPPVVAVAATQNPLVAQYSITSTCRGQATVEFGPDTTYGRSTASYDTPGAAGGFTANILVAGMKPSTTYHMRSTFNCNGSTFTSADQTFTTGALPTNVKWPSLQVSRPNPSLSSKENSGIELINIFAPGSGAMQSIITDRDGNPIWYYDVGVAQGFAPYTYKLLPNGHMVVSITKSVAQGTVLREIDLAGNTIREMDTATLDSRMQVAGFNFAPAGYHHDLFPLQNGHLIVLVNYTQNFTNLPGYPGTTAVLGDGLVDLDENWNPVWAWSAFDHLDVNRHLNGLPDWTHGNAVIYSPDDGNLLLSMRHQSWVIKIDYNNGAGAGDIIWRLGYQGDFTLPGDDPADWFSFQHFPSLVTQNGSQTTLAIWDNGDNRVLNTSGTICVPPTSPCFSRATIFQVDESTKAANLLWDDLPGYFGIWGGSINQLANNNVEFDVNSPAGFPFGSMVEEVTQTTTPQIVWQMQIGPVPLYAYRAYRVPSLYPGVTWTN
jgi:arylsulfate sulfotransferase